MRAKGLFPRASKCGDRRDCRCIICLELKQSGSSLPTAMAGGPAGNFILRRALPFVSRTPTREWQEEAASDLESDYERRATLPRCTAPPAAQEQQQQQQQQQPHKTVIYFGDTTRREKEHEAELERNKAVIRVGGVPGPADDCKTLLALREPEVGEEHGDAQIIVSVKPCREDVLKIEQDESKLEDYWSLPGDTTGFKADWSFVQQWRLRG